MIPPYNPAYATTQLPHPQQQPNNGQGQGKETTMPMPSLGPAATPSFGLSMNGPTIPLISSSRPDSNFRRLSKYINKESAKKACKTGYGYLAKTGEWVDRMAQPAMPYLAATNPDIAAMYQFQQALGPGLQQQQQQQQLGAAGASDSSSSDSSGFAAVGGLAAAGLAGYAMLQGMGGDGFTSTTDPNSSFDTFTQILAGATQQQAQPDLSALLQGAAGGQQSDLISALLQQQQQQSGDTTASLLGSLVGGIAQGDQADPSQQVMDAIQQQTATSTQTLLAAMQNDPSAAQGQQDFASQLLGALNQQQQQQQPQAQADLLAAIQQQQAASTQALLSVIQGASTNGQNYGSQAFASILQQQQQQQAATTQAFLSTLQQQPQKPAQQTSSAPPQAQPNSTLSPQEHAAYEEQLLNAALQQQQQQYGASRFTSSNPATHSGEAFMHTVPQTSTNHSEPAPTGASQNPYSPSSGLAQDQQPLAHQQTGGPSPNQYTGTTNNDYYPVTPQTHAQAQTYAQQGPSAPISSALPAFNPVATSPQFQQHIPSQLELAPSNHNSQNITLPQQQTQQSSAGHQGAIPQPTAATPFHHFPDDNLAAANIPPLPAGIASQQQQPHPLSHTQQPATSAAAESAGAAVSIVQAAASITPQQQPQHIVSQEMPQVEQSHSASINTSNIPEVTVIQQSSLHGQPAPEINLSPPVKLESNTPQPPPSPSPNTAPLASEPPIPEPPAGPRPPLKTDQPPWTQHHLPKFGIESISLPAGTTLQEASPNTLTGELDAPHGSIAFEVRLLYDPAQIEHETDWLRRAVSTQDFVIIEPYRSYPSPPDFVPSSSSCLPGKETTATREGAKAQAESGAEAATATTADDDDDDLDIIPQSQIHALTLASNTPDDDGDIMALHKLVAVPPPYSSSRTSSSCFNHGLVFSFYAPLLPPPDLDSHPVKRLAATVLGSILWADRSTSCKVVSEKLLGTWVLLTPLNPSPSSPGPSAAVVGVDGTVASSATVVMKRLTGASVGTKNREIDISKEALVQQYETKALRFMEGRRYTYSSDIVNENSDIVGGVYRDDNSKRHGGEEPYLGQERAHFDSNHTRGRFEMYEYLDGSTHLVLTEDDTGSVEVQTIKLTDQGMLVRGRNYMKTA
ncbi:hypothetical protein PG991_010999 [Apiospora marii]|uniref:Uncharacterized protein n=1 Tax=Apiospora marii TaxID=335849 RepID=A0ABR1RDZ5_9PEZI